MSTLMHANKTGKGTAVRGISHIPFNPTFLRGIRAIQSVRVAGVILIRRKKACVVLKNLGTPLFGAAESVSVSEKTRVRIP